jgi:hypothetical protein
MGERTRDVMSVTAGLREPADPIRGTLIFDSSFIGLSMPRFDRNLNTGEDQATGTRRQTAAQTILHDQRYPSHILLPVIPR